MPQTECGWRRAAALTKAHRNRQPNIGGVTILQQGAQQQHDSALAAQGTSEPESHEHGLNQNIIVDVVWKIADDPKDHNALRNRVAAMCSSLELRADECIGRIGVHRRSPGYELALACKRVRHCTQSLRLHVHHLPHRVLVTRQNVDGSGWNYGDHVVA
eukprot:1143662-Prymnesium_polylepis.4